MFAPVQTGLVLGTEAAERVAVHEGWVFVQSAGVCPSSLQLTETLMLVKGPPALVVFTVTAALNSAGVVGSRCPLLQKFHRATSRFSLFMFR